MASFGELMLYVSVLLSAAGGAVCLARGSSRRHFNISRSLLMAAAAASAVALVALVFLLITHDYRVEYVRDYADRTMSLGYLLTAVWGGQEGSLMIWAVLQTWFTAAAAVWMSKREDLTHGPVAFGFLAAVQVFFILLVLFHSNPFEPLGTTAVKGIGLNPLLRNVYMVLHPPTLYLGFVGFSIPMAFVIAALAEGKTDGDWLTSLRPWIMFAWVFLSIGNILGMIWAYEELGWGGYWGWDPVENAAFMPWLTGTALVHSLMAEERRGVLRRWNILLVIFTFVLIIFGTFLTRSGVIESVHSFAGATAGPYFLGMIAVTGLLPLVLLFVRFVRLRPTNALGPILSRDWALLVGNWVFTVAALFVWVATMMPLFAEVFAGQKVTMTPEFFNRWMVPIGLVVLGLLGVCSLVGWKVRPSGDRLFAKFAVPLLAGVAAGTGSVFWGAVRTEFEGPMAFAPAISIGLLVMLGVALIAGLRRTFIAGGDSGRSGKNLRRRLGGQLIHASVLLMFIGFTGSGFTQEGKGAMGPGDFMDVAGYHIGFIGLRGESDFERDAVFADLTVRSPDGKDLGVMSPARFIYHSHPGRPTSEVVIDTSLAEDLFLVLGETDSRGRGIIRVVVNPLVLWIWLGGFLMVLGTLVALVRPGWFRKLLSFDEDLQERILRPLMATGGVLVVAIGCGLVINLPAALVVLGSALLLYTLYYVAMALRAVADSGRGGSSS